MFIKLDGVDLKKLSIRNLPYYTREQKIGSLPKSSIPESEQISWVYQSEFHYYIVRPDCISIVNLISDKLVEHKKVLAAHQFPNDAERVCYAISHDGSLVINLAKEKLFFKFAIVAEGNDSWNLQLEKKNFREAYELSQRYRPEFRDHVASMYAHRLFEEEKYLEAADLFSTIKIPFERILLLYLEKADHHIEAQYGLISSLASNSRAGQEEDIHVQIAGPNDRANSHGQLAV